MNDPEFHIRVNAKQAVRDLEGVKRALQSAADAHTKPGVRTTEFWLTLLLVTVGAVAAAVPQLMVDVHGSDLLRVAAVASAAVAVAAYSLSRAIAKRGPTTLASDGITADGVTGEEVPTERIPPQPRPR